MPYLYCEKHGLEREEGIIAEQVAYRRADETVLVASGPLISGPWHCDRCNARLGPGDHAVLVSAFPSHCRDDLRAYNFAYERQYFAMFHNDQATAYGAPWPDDSVRNRRKLSRGTPRQTKKPLCALDFARKA